MILGLAAVHVDHAVKEKNIKGKFQIVDEPELKLPENIEYILLNLYALI